MKPIAHVLCPECFAAEGRREEKSCCHGIFAHPCVRCGKMREYGEKPYWHCVGGLADDVPVSK